MPQLPNHYKLILTDDGSETLFSEDFNEACHSTAGAIEETRFHYLQGCELEHLASKYDENNILEVGFGAGVGWSETKKFFLARPQIKLNFFSLELDENLIPWSTPEAKRVEREGRISYHHTEMNTHLSVLIGDARQTIHQHPLPPLHAIYQDAFSPKRNPALWTHQWFLGLKLMAHPECRLSTYSASVSIRKSLLKAGWNVKEGAAFAQKRSSTRANLFEPTNTELLTKLNSHAIAALDDKDL